MRPLLKWAGGKSRIADKLCEAFEEPCEGLYVEPFLGSAAVYLHRRAAGEIGAAYLSDANPKLIEMHKAVRDQLDDVLEELHRMPVEEYRDVYYAVREAFNEGPHVGPRHAARFLWLNRAGLNGLYRENRKGGFNVPVGRYKKVRIPEEARFRAVSEALQSAELVAQGFDVTMARAGRGDQVYCDPPYVPLNASADFTAYCKQPFGMKQQQALATASMEAAFRGARVVLSNHDLPLVRRELYKTSLAFRIHASFPVSRAISRSVQSRKPILEVIAAIGPIDQAA